MHQCVINNLTTATPSWSKKVPMMKVIEHFESTVRQIPRDVDDDGHKKISMINNFFWGTHLSVTITLFAFIVMYDGILDSAAGTGLVILQLMVTKIFESINRLYDNALMIQSNTVDIKDVIINIIKDYHSVFDTSKKDDPEYERCIESIAVLDHQIRDDLVTYSKNMRTWRIVVNSFFWKSPDHTPLLEKDAIKEKLLRIISRMAVIGTKRVGVHDTSPEFQSLRVMAY
ncbi:hypothetical protein ATCVMN08101_668L [Acanthocystis turfacea Chlorella virus MN0810.1]|nr:hypothetical protein ATCVMN08101_668L [Acanthocystis turfacea Chlorella virus MN0810.1]